MSLESEALDGVAANDLLFGIAFGGVYGLVFITDLHAAKTLVATVPIQLDAEIVRNAVFDNAVTTGEVPTNPSR